MEEVIKGIGNSYVLRQYYQIRLENTPEETLETIKYNTENKAVTQPPSKGAHSLTKDVQQEQKEQIQQQQTGK